MRAVERYFLACLFAISGFQLSFAANPAETIPQQQVQRTLNSVPLAFEPNVGQASPGTKFLVHRAALVASFAPDAISIALPVKGAHAARLEIGFDRSARILGEQELPGKANYLRGNNPAAWHTGIANFGRIRYSQLWPGIDLVFYGNGEHLEHDFLVAPNADPRRIFFTLRGAQTIKTGPEGDLLVDLGQGLITFKKPVAYQETASGRKPVASAFQVNGTKISFRMGQYDRGRALIIDPVLVFSTLLAGSTFDGLSAMTVDAQGNIYVAGVTNSTDFPTASAEQPTCNNCSGGFDDVFVTKLNPTGTALIYSTFLGGSNEDGAHSIAVDSNGNAVVSGITLSSDFPAVKPIGTFTCCDIWHMFVASLSPAGNTLNYSGIVGPLNNASFVPTLTPIPSSIFVPLSMDSAGNAYATVQTIYSSFPTTPSSAIIPVPPNPQAAILVAMKISPTGSLLYSTGIPGRAASAPPGNFGAPGPNTFFQTAIAVDSAGSAYIAGQANDGLPTTAGVIGPAFASDSGFFVFFPQEGFVLKLNPAGSAITYATYVPGTSKVTAMRVDGSGNAYLAGVTSSPSLPVSATGFQKDPGCAGCQAAFLLKLNPTATTSLAGTYVRGVPRLSNDPANIAHIALDTNGNVFATGSDSKAANFPMKNPLVQLLSGFVIEFNNDLSTLLFSSGGPDSVIEVAAPGKIILAGNSGFPPTPGAFQTTVSPGRSVLFSLPQVSAIDLTVPAPALCLNTFGLDFGTGVVAPGSTSAPKSATVTNCGNGDLHISSVTSDSPDYAVSTSCSLAPAAIAPGSSCTVSATYSPVDYNRGNIVIQSDALESPHKVGLSGFPKAPATGFNPTSLTFLETPITTTIGLPLRVINTGTQPLTISSMTTTGDFSIDPRCAQAVIPVFVFVPPFGVPANNVCDFTVFFSPTNTGTRTGTLIVKDNSLDSPHIVQLSGLGLAAWPTPAVNTGSSVNVAGIGGQVNGSPGSAKTLVLTGGGFSRVTFARVDGMPFDNSNRVFKLVSPQELDLTLADNDFGDVGEVPVQVITPAPGGGTANTVATISSPVKFYDFTARQIEMVGGGSLVVGPKSGLIYDATGTAFLEAPNIPVPSVAVVDPVEERLVSGLVNFPNRATVLAISDDEQFLYAAIPGSNGVAQISLPSGNINFIASLGADPVLGKYNATSIRVMPGHPHTWVAALQPVFDTKPIAVKVFDDATARANTVEQGNASSIFPGKLLFVGSDTTSLYSIDSTSLYRFKIDANGITFTDKTAGLGAADFETDGALLYLSTGAIIDPATLANTGNFPLAPGLTVHAVVVDGTTSRAIFASDGPVNSTGPSSLIQGFNTKTLASTGSFTMPVGGANFLLRWGSSGLVMNSSAGLTLTRTSLTGNSGLLAPFHIGANAGTGPIGAVQVRQGDPAVYNLGILGINGFNGPVTLSCSNLPQAASCSFSQNPVTPGSGTIISGGNFIVTISTHQAATASAAPAHTYMKSGAGFMIVAALLSLPFGLAFAGRRYRGRLIAFCLLVAIIGCGGGGTQTGGGGGGSPTPTPTPAGTTTPIGVYDIILTGTSASGTRHAVLQLLVVG
jgi:hypothetical protein